VKEKTKDFIQALGHELYLDDEDEEKGTDFVSEVLHLIGIVVWGFNQLEQSLNVCICDRVSDRAETMGRLVIQGMQYSAKVELYKRLCDDFHAMFGEVPPAYVQLVENLKKAGVLRNLVVHADWQSTDAEGYTFVRLKLTGKGNFQQEYRQFTPEAMEEIVAEIDRVHHQLSDHSEQLWELGSDGYQAK
jgi:hypothetical protein